VYRPGSVGGPWKDGEWKDVEVEKEGRGREREEEGRRK